MRIVDLRLSNAAPPDRVWAVLSDFAGFLNWATSGEIRMEGSDIGMIRHLKIPGLGEIAERLMSFDNESRSMGYQLEYGEPIGMRVYRANVQVISKRDGFCELHWLGQFEAVDPTQEDQVAEYLRESFESMTKALEVHVQTFSHSS